MRLLRRIAREQRGTTAVTVALLFPAFLVFGVLAADVGNWYVHKRELQTQADAAALAGAAYFRFPCDDAPISAAAQGYAGKDHNVFDDDHNVFRDVSEARSTFLLNAENYFEQSKPGDADLSGSPCADAAVDVKMTERNVPWLFGNLFTPFINAQSRVSIRRLERLDGLLPVGVPVPDPKRVRVTFISEVTGETLGYKDLCEASNPENGLQIWDNSATNAGWNQSKGACDNNTTATPLPQTFNDPKYARVGVRVQLSGSASTIDCTDQLVTCYDTTTTGLGFVHGWSDEPAVTNTANSAPQARSVVLLPGTCGDAYFSTKSTTCTVGLRASVDFQPQEYNGDGSPKSAISVKAIVTNASGSSSSYNLAWDSATKTWQTSNVNVAGGAGPLNVKLHWEQTDNKVGSNDCNSKNNNPCVGDTAVVQRTVSATESHSGPVQLLQIGDDQGNTSGVTDVQRCSSSHPSCTTNFVVRVGVGGTLKLSKPDDPPTVLRVSGGSQTQAIDCDTLVEGDDRNNRYTSLKDQIANGCTPSYGRNTGQACPDHSTTDTQPAGASYYCVWTQTGSSPSQVSNGMNERILGSEKASSCTAPNHWPNYDPGDPRILPVFVVPYGSFKGSGNQSFPVQDFAFFYITGWTGQGNGSANPCQGNGDDPVPGDDAGDIVGHFIGYVESVNNGGGSDTPCDLSGSSIGGCVAVMTR